MPRQNRTGPLVGFCCLWPATGACCAQASGWNTGRLTSHGSAEKGPPEVHIRWIGIDLTLQTGRFLLGDADDQGAVAGAATRSVCCCSQKKKREELLFIGLTIGKTTSICPCTALGAVTKIHAARHLVIAVFHSGGERPCSRHSSLSISIPRRQLGTGRRTTSDNWRIKQKSLERRLDLWPLLF